MLRAQNKERLVKRLYRIFDLLMPDLEEVDQYLTYPLFNPREGVRLASEISKLEGFYAAEKKTVEFGRADDPEIMAALETGKEILGARQHDES